ncbi:hypothetical protein [Microbacterium sp.]|uniref:hypothetical protein n=1 Tax=Microbacterium sp. TaxID=51671 RepID=UPI0035B214F1
MEYDSSAYPDCDPVPQAAISPHGLAFRPHEDGLGGELLVINHEREAVEVFDVGSEGSSVTLTWIGCVPLAADMYGNGVAVSDDGETLFVTKFFNPATRDADLGALLSGDPSGEVRTWTKGEGWRAVPGTELAGANGIALSPDASAIFVAEWGGQKLWRFDLTGDTEPQSVALDFWPDNLRWGDDGLLYVTGQEVTPAQVPSCLAGDITACPYTGFDILAIDPETLDTSVVFAYDGQDFGHTTVALPVGDDYWIGTIFGDKVGKLTAAP